MADDYKIDRIENTLMPRANVEMPVLPELVLKDGEFAFVVQRAIVPNGFKGTVQLHTVNGETVLAPYLKDLKAAVSAITELQDALLDLPTEGSASPPGKTLYTTTATINAAASDSIFIDGEGDIQFPAAPVDGTEITIFDPSRKIKAGKNNVLIGAGDRWLLSTGAYGTTALTFADNQLLGGSVTLKYSAPTKAWSAYVTYGSPVQPTTTSGPGLKPARLTTDAVLTANPFDVIHLDGTGNVQIGTFAELEYFDVQWDGVHDVTVLRPTGFTIYGADDDLQLDTAQMSVSRVRLMRVGSNFEVS